MATNTRKLSDFLAEGSGDTFGDLPVENPHIKPGTLYPAWSGLLEDNTGFTFTDSGNTGHTLTPNGDVYHDGRQKKIGSTALKFDGSDYISAPDHADWQLGTSMTIEAWVYVSAVNTDNVIIAQGGDGGSDVDGFCFRLQSGGNLQYNQYQSSALTSFSFAHGMSVNTWHHVAVSRDGTTIRMFVDGVLKTSATTSGVIAAVPNSGLTLTIGKAHTSHWYFNGHIDEIRVSSSARYTSAFTPSTSAFTSDSNTKLLIHSDAGGHSGAYGTAQSDGLKYYYTDIKGSKPIKDPRIGAYFGSQRHDCQSVQTLEQETATHGKNIQSVDGREWCRTIDTVDFDNGSNGINIQMKNQNNSYIEITGYFSDVNVGMLCGSGRTVEYQIDGGTITSNNYGSASVNTPLGGRYVKNSGLVNLGVPSSSGNPTLGIHTIKIKHTGSSHLYFFLFDLIAQDTTSTATKSKIQIPAQTVVSYGKKFALSAAAQHYNPFAQSQTGAAVTINSSTTNTAKLTGGWSGTGATYYSSELDTATSLGLSAWVSGGEYFRPVNGGRIVWWINSSGSLKCSVNMMSPAGTAVGGNTSGHNVPTGVHNWATKNQPALHSTTIDHSQAEVAKTFHWREFGNGAANGGTNASNYADASMLKTGTSDNVAYVMDDGLTSLSAENVEGDSDELTFRFNGNTDFFIAFIGTGISIEKKVSDTQAGSDSLTYTLDGVALTTYSSSNATHPKFINLAQNLPYGTHILKVSRAGLSNVHPFWKEFTFHQPKKPPIPENAVVLADYMLMADFVPQTASGIEKVSKGVRTNSPSRDCFYDNTSGSGSFDPVSAQPLAMGGLEVCFDTTSAANTIKQKLPFFGTNFVSKGYSHDNQIIITLDDVDKDSASTRNGDNNRGSYAHLTTDIALGVYVAGKLNTASTNPCYGNMDIVTPIHTSFHYQTVETSYLHELVGGDRNMEQHNLVVTADGKTWDEVTRDVSYIGPSTALVGTRNGGHVSSDNPCIFDECRGIQQTKPCFNKNIAYGYDRFIILEEGLYRVQLGFYNNPQDAVVYILKNSTSDDVAYGTIGRADSPDDTTHIEAVWEMKRGDWIYTRVRHGGTNSMSGTNAGYTLMSIQKLN